MKLHTFAGYVFLVVLTGCGESFEQRLDREVGWREIKPHYDAIIGGLKIGEITVPGHTQQVATFFMWGISKDALYGDDEEPYVIGEMDRDSDLGRLAEAAYYHGGSRVILTERKAYVVTSDSEQGAIHEAQHNP